MQMSKVMYLLALFGAIPFQLQGCGGGDTETEEKKDVGTETTAKPTPTITKIQSALNFEGLTVDQAKAIEPAIKDGIVAGLTGVAASDVEITGFEAVASARRLSDRRLDGHATKVNFEVTVPATMDAAVLETAVTAAAENTESVKAIWDAIVAAVEASPELTSALSDAGITLTDLKANVKVTMDKPKVVVEEVKPTDAPTDAPTEAPTEAPTDAPTEAPVNGTNTTGRRLEFAFTTNELIA